MAYCKNCGLHIMDESASCIFCGRVLTKEDGEERSFYPAVYQKTRMIKKVVGVITFVLVLVQMLLMVLNYYFDAGHGWSYITGICILYALVFMHYTLLRKQSYIRKLFVQSVVTLLFIVAMDGVLGFTGWSLQYGIAIGVLVLDGIVLSGMLIDRNNWVHYMVVQVFGLAVSILYMGMYLFHITHSALLAWLVLFVTVILFGSTMLAGSRKAKSELRRRFYI